jgi:DNA end-binding protein Ku
MARGDEEADGRGEAEREEGHRGGQADAHDREPAEADAKGPRQAGRHRAPARRGRRRGSLEDRNRQQLYDVARRMDIPGRSRMGKWELIDAIRRAR